MIHVKSIEEPSICVTSQFLTVTTHSMRKKESLSVGTVSENNRSSEPKITKVDKALSKYTSSDQSKQIDESMDLDPHELSYLCPEENPRSLTLVSSEPKEIPEVTFTKTDELGSLGSPIRDQQ